MRVIHENTDDWACICGSTKLTLRLEQAEAQVAELIRERDFKERQRLHNLTLYEVQTQKRMEAEAKLTQLREREQRLVVLAKNARSVASAPDYDEEAIKDALWKLVDAALREKP